MEQRKKELQKWKQERDKRKKEIAMKSKKPFIFGKVHHQHPLRYVPPPPINKPRKVQQTKNVNDKMKEKETEAGPSRSQPLPPSPKNEASTSSSASEVGIKPAIQKSLPVVRRLFQSSQSESPQTPVRMAKPSQQPTNRYGDG